MIRRIFLPLTGGEGDVAALAAAFTTARQSRLQEFLLGGVTGYVFGHATLPVLVAH